MFDQLYHQCQGPDYCRVPVGSSPHGIPLKEFWRRYHEERDRRLGIWSDPTDSPTQSRTPAPKPGGEERGGNGEHAKPDERNNFSMGDVGKSLQRYVFGTERGSPGSDGAGMMGTGREGGRGKGRMKLRG